MMPNARAELFETLAQLCRRYPNWRFGQLVANVSGWADAVIWDAEDETLLAAARAHLEQTDNGHAAMRACRCGASLAKPEAWFRFASAKVPR